MTKQLTGFILHCWYCPGHAPFTRFAIENGADVSGSFEQNNPASDNFITRTAAAF